MSRTTTPQSIDDRRLTYDDLSEGERVRELVQELTGKQPGRAERVDSYFDGDPHSYPRWLDITYVCKHNSLVLDFAPSRETDRYLSPDDHGWTEYRNASHQEELTRHESRKKFPDKAVIPRVDKDIRDSIENRTQGGRIALAPESAIDESFQNEYLRQRSVIGVDADGDTHVWDDVRGTMYVIDSRGLYVWADDSVETDDPYAEIHEQSNDSITSWVQFVDEKIGWQTLNRELHRDAIA